LFKGLKAYLKEKRDSSGSLLAGDPGKAEGKEKVKLPPNYVKIKQRKRVHLIAIPAEIMRQKKLKAGDVLYAIPTGNGLKYVKMEYQKLRPKK
jgi:hypothetical protein